jgi:hypothetical protein
VKKWVVTILFAVLLLALALATHVWGKPVIKFAIKFATDNDKTVDSIEKLLELLIAIGGLIVPVVKWLISEHPQSDRSHSRLDELVSKQRLLDAAIPGHVVRDRPTEVLILVRLVNSEGLTGKLLADEEADARPDDVRSKPFNLVFSADSDGNLKPIQVAVRLTSPDFFPNEQTKNLFIQHDANSEILHFVLTPIRIGQLRVLIELQWQDALHGSRSLRTECVAESESIPAGAGVNVAHIQMEASISRDMRFYVQTPDGIVRPIAFPSDQPVGVLLRETVSDDDLEIQSPKPETWRLVRESTGETLDLNKNLEQNGVSHGERLQLSKASKEARGVWHRTGRRQLSEGLQLSKASKEARGREIREGGPARMNRCENGHFYDPRKHTTCPYDDAAGIELMGGPPGIKIGPAIDGDVHTRPQGMEVGPAIPGVGDDAPTRVIRFTGLTAIDSVVGWLVVVNGPEKGRDYRIRSENNTIGRSEGMYICISGDESISRERHAVITFDPQQNAFHLCPGEGRGPVYVNGEVLLADRKLQAYDQIQLGKTKLVFVPFCGDEFAWGRSDH